MAKDFIFLFLEMGRGGIERWVIGGDDDDDVRRISFLCGFRVSLFHT